MAIEPSVGNATTSALLAGTGQAAVGKWLPEINGGSTAAVAASFWRELLKGTDNLHEVEAEGISAWKGVRFTDKGDHWFDAASWTHWTSCNWQIPLLSVTMYFIAIPALRKFVREQGSFNVRRFAFCWNAGLSLFSLCGVAYCVPVLWAALQDHGLYFTTCAPASWYTSDTTGLFVALFIYSKVAELGDTVLLLLAGKPVIALQWWHHSTVLLYCWHSYASRIATGLWFAAMNYTVHTIMYGYFALAATPFRRRVSRYAIFITAAQLLQMVVGMFVTVRAVMYQAEGQECHVNRTNSIVGLLMYFSYFVLFFKLFIESYVTRTRRRSAAASASAADPLKSSSATSISSTSSDDWLSQAPPVLGVKVPRGRGSGCGGPKSKWD